MQKKAGNVTLMEYNIILFVSASANALKMSPITDREKKNLK